MRKIPFTVSARTARLIGRENIASSKGAIVELVKNCYDADSPIAIIYFKRIIETVIEKEIIDGKEVDVENKVDKSELFIIDAGEGMTEQIIKKHWMTIGTNNKESDFFTKSGRVKAGAKGIGRFALDKLGDKCEMITKFNPKVHKDVDDNGQDTNFKAYQWEVDWTDFEGAGKTIDQVSATLIGAEELDLKDYLLNEINDENIKNVIQNYSFEYGTIFKISSLRDEWEDFYVEQVFNDLEVLVPPKEQNTFELYLYSSENPNEYGQLIGSICDDYDYKLVAKADENQKVSIRIYREEYDLERINPKLFDYQEMKEDKFTLKSFQKGYWDKETTFSKLLPGYEEVDAKNNLGNIGTFEFTLYFMKKDYLTKDIEKFFYKKFNSNERKAWLDKFGGIKIFRDDFRVRPYGESKDSAFDWLGLGGIKSKSPAPIAHKSRGWKVGPSHISGAINISRIGNINFQDKSSREGLQENESFKIFKEIIISIIKVFEKDRAQIAYMMNKLDYDVNFDRRQQEEADKLAKRILEEQERRRKNNKSGTEEDSEKIQLAQSNKDKDAKIEKLEDEQKTLRGMASSGIVIASFTHELGNLNEKLQSRMEKLKQLFARKVSEDTFQDVQDYMNPYILMEEMQKQDNKLSNWLKFSLASARRDKRKRKKINLINYFENFKNSWESVLQHRHITFKLNILKKDLYEMRFFEIDIDSIYNNLLVNSIEAMSKEKTREITISLNSNDKEIIIDYTDTGKGLSKDIENPYDIFEPLYTTKRNKHTGEVIGTGLGMWIIKTIVKDYDGSYSLVYPKNGGFGLRISFIKKYLNRS
ncbi:ATP-binding protein [Sulfurimonas sp.]|uniref:ATP-binding protein n=1 Tax=Sulfurimonas sp. TaxID=2022749 RepID=UPI003561ED25